MVMIMSVTDFLSLDPGIVSDLVTYLQERITSYKGVHKTTQATIDKIRLNFQGYAIDDAEEKIAKLGDMLDHTTDLTNCCNELTSNHYPKDYADAWRDIDRILGYCSGINHVTDYWDVVNTATGELEDFEIEEGGTVQSYQKLLSDKYAAFLEIDDGVACVIAKHIHTDEHGNPISKSHAIYKQPATYDPVLANHAGDDFDYDGKKWIPLFHPDKDGHDVIDRSDILQGRLGDCVVMSLLGGLASQHPEEIENMIHPDGRWVRGAVSRF